MAHFNGVKSTAFICKKVKFKLPIPTPSKNTKLKVYAFYFTTP